MENACMYALIISTGLKTQSIHKNKLIKLTFFPFSVYVFTCTHLILVFSYLSKYTQATYTEEVCIYDYVNVWK